MTVRPPGWFVAMVWSAESVTASGAGPIARKAVWLDVAGGEGCPDAREVASALYRAGVAIVDRASADLDVRLRRAGNRVSVALSDRERRLLAARYVPANDCGAAAEAIALIVQRHLQQLPYDTRRPPRPTPRGAVSATPPTVEACAGVLVSADLEDEAPAVGPAAGLWASGGGWFEAGLTTAWLRQADLAAGGGTVTLDRFPFRLHGALSLRRRSWRAGVGAVLGLDVLRAKSHDLPRTEGRTALAVRGGALGYLGFRLSEGWHALVGGDALMLASGYDLEVQGVGRVARQAFVAVEGTVSLAYRLRP